MMMVYQCVFILYSYHNKLSQSKKKRKLQTECGGGTIVIPATYEGSSIVVEGTRQKQDTLFEIKVKQKGLGGVVQVVEWLPSKPDALSSNPQPNKQNPAAQNMSPFLFK
jgi:hypothetical protein